MTEETPLMDKYTDDLTAAVALNPDAYRAIARDDEIRQVIYNLNAGINSGISSNKRPKYPFH